MPSPSSSSLPASKHVIGTPKAEVKKALEDFRAIEQVRPKDTTYVAQHYRLLNRYLDVVPFDKYVFPSPHEKPMRYINGSLIDSNVDGVAVAPTFVACQAPIPAGMFDFFSTIATSRIKLVLMLTSLEEGGVVKADKYWPDSAVKGATLTVPCPNGSSDSLIIEQAEDENVDGALRLVKRVLRIRNASAETPGHVFTQVQYTGWPDHGVPSSTDAFCHLIHEIERYHTAHGPANVALRASSEVLPGKSLSAEQSRSVGGASPVMVHCSAGVGRTGTLIAAYAGVQLAKAKGRTPSTLSSLVTDMRRRRPYMVQRFEQYLYANAVILAHCGADVESFKAEMNAAIVQYNVELQERLRLMMAAQQKK